jgi:MFS transporter, DHA1 family, inner membrane transport protein
MTQPRQQQLAIATLGLGAFTVGTSELVVVGILNDIARDLDVAVSTAGTLVTAYASGIAIGGPILTALTGRVGRRPLLLLGLTAYAALNLLTAVLPHFGVLVAARFAAGSVHGAFIGVASVAAVAIAGPGREGRALSIVFGGVALSTVIGVPLGTLVGQTSGWRATFLGVVFLGSVALALTAAVVPSVGGRNGSSTSEATRSAIAPPVLATLGVGLLIIGGQFAALTYVEPFLDRVTGVSGGTVSGFLLAFGAATAVGTFAGGRAADRSAAMTLIAADAAVIGVLGLLYVVGPEPVLVGLALVAWGLVGFGLVSTALQLRVISLAGTGGDLAASLGASAANAGIAIGALVGGQVVAHQGARDTALAGAAICLLALPAAIATRKLHPAAAPAHDADESQPTSEETVGR